MQFRKMGDALALRILEEAYNTLTSIEDPSEMTTFEQQLLERISEPVPPSCSECGMPVRGYCKTAKEWASGAYVTGEKCEACKQSSGDPFQDLCYKFERDFTATFGDVAMLGIRPQLSYKSLNGRRYQTKDWEGFCTLVVEKLTGRPIGRCTLAGTGFRTRWFGLEAAVAIRAKRDGIKEE